MTAPTAIADISTQIASIQARISAVTAPVKTAATSSSTAGATTSGTTTSSASFANALATASGTTSTTDSTGASTVSGTGAVTGADVVADAKKYLGIPYVWGGESDTGIDCSGLVQKTYSDLGIKLPRVAADQQQKGTSVPSLAQAQPGDLLFFGNPAYHVAIYLGNNQLIESPEPGKTVHITDVYQTPTNIKRIVETEPATTTASSMAVSAGASGGLSAAALTTAGVSPAVADYANQFAAAEKQFHLPAGMLAAVAQQESGGNARAVSPAGAEGLMQLMPATAAGAGVDAFDPTQAITAAARILSGNLSRFHNSVPLALAAYNAGAGAVEQYGGIPPYAETQNYVTRITATMAAGG